MWTSVPAFERPSALPGLSIQGSVRVWQHQAGEVGNVRVVPHRGRAGQRQLAGRPHAAPGWLRHGAGARSSRASYVFEHILVADELLGRYLVEGESVHHINGVGDDNRPENLELWTRPQPSGIRVSDAISWAREIYDRYVRAGAPPTVLTVSPEHPWRWRGSNPRPSVLQQSFSERSRWRDLGPSTITGSDGGPQSVEVSPRAH